MPGKDSKARRPLRLCLRVSRVQCEKPGLKCYRIGLRRLRVPHINATWGLLVHAAACRCMVASLESQPGGPAERSG